MVVMVVVVVDSKQCATAIIAAVIIASIRVVKTTIKIAMGNSLDYCY